MSPERTEVHGTLKQLDKLKTRERLGAMNEIVDFYRSYNDFFILLEQNNPPKILRLSTKHTEELERAIFTQGESIIKGKLIEDTSKLSAIKKSAESITMTRCYLVSDLNDINPKCYYIIDDESYGYFISKNDIDEG